MFNGGNRRYLFSNCVKSKMKSFKAYKLSAILLLLCGCLGPGCSNARIEQSEKETRSPVRGGMLEIVGRSDVDHLATTSAYVASTWGLFRAFIRTLVTYPSSVDFGRAIRLVPDLAQEVPSRENGGISADGLTYTFHLQRGIRWNASSPREVTAHDFIRAFRFLCNPVSPVGAPGYYTSTIVGLASYCMEFARVSGTVLAIREFVTTHGFEGIQAVDDFTLIFRLLTPTPEFLNLLAMPFAAPVPREYLDYLPDSPEFRQHTLSNGPYRITRYIQNREMLLERNPVWDPAKDPIRPGYVDRIYLRFGMDSQLQQLQIASGMADMSYDEEIPTSERAALTAVDDATMWLSPPGDSSIVCYFLTINHVGPKSRTATRHLLVRRALAVAVDKAALIQLSGGPRFARTLRQAVASCVSGYREGADHYATPGDRGDPVKARALLAAAGYPDGITLRLVYPILASSSLAAQSLQASLARAGITIELVPMTSGDFWGRFLTNPEHARSGEWDLALTGWVPDWFGENNGRSVIEPLFDSRYFGSITSNYGGYSNHAVDALIDRATTAPSISLAEKAWSEAVQKIMEDVAIVPLIEVKMAFAHSRRLRNCTWNVFGPNCDITSVWLADAVNAKEIQPTGTK
jgi:ABC-type transport system substrate-binding protein